MSPETTNELINLAQRLRELEAQLADLRALQTSLAINQTIWPNNWSQPVAMIAYEFHLKQTQLANAQKDAARYTGHCRNPQVAAWCGLDPNAPNVLAQLDAFIDAAMQPKE